MPSRLQASRPSVTPTSVAARSFLIIGLALAVDTSAQPLLKSDTEVANAGFYQLEWDADGQRVRLEEVDGEGRTSIVYEGHDAATLISGKADGVYRYRLGTQAVNGDVSAWSEPLRVTVSHHPLQRALAFFALGAVVFLATLALIISGARRET